MPLLNPELETLEFPVLVDLVAGFARTQGGRAALAALHPWDGRTGLRRLRQMELEELAARQPAPLSVQAMDEALDELLDPAGWLLPEHWRQLREGLKALTPLLRALAVLDWPEGRPAPEGAHLGIDRLQATAAALPEPEPVAARLSKTFNAEGELDPARVPGLAELFQAQQRAFQAVQAKLQRIIRGAGEALQEGAVVERNGRFCLPVRSERRGQVPGLVLDRSGSGATVFLEPFDAVPLNNDYVEAASEFAMAVQAYLRQLLDELRARRPDFVAWRAFLADVDEAAALLRWARLCEGLLPELGAAALDLKEARHPLLLRAVREALDMEALDHEVIPLDLHLDADRPSLVISGSNTGGKTVALKTVGLLMAMGHAGLAIPAADGTRLPGLTTLHADIGDHQTLLGSLSTFSSHIVHLKKLLLEARAGGFVLLDELGTGTDPKEGAALGVALLKALSRRGCWVLCSTHLGDISQFALRHPKFQNASVQFDEEKLAPTFRLLVGLPGQSRALTIAAKLGLPDYVLASAEKALGQREQDWREFLRQLEADRLRLQEEAAALKLREAAVEKDRKILSHREEALRKEAERLHQEGKEKVQRVLDFLDHEGKRLVKELKAKQKEEGVHGDRLLTDTREKLKVMERIAAAELAAQAPRTRSSEAPPELKLGGFARHRGFNLEGKVTALKGDRVTLETQQGRRIEARVGELEAITGKEAGPRKGSVRIRVEAADIESELNLIGRASDDVDTEVHRFVERALGSGARFIRIVHGHGTGRLKMAVREALKGHPAIAGIEDAPQAQGGAGATVITLR
ncbi:MAG: Smr/MutS family protein [Holophagaceae bacterium]|nr:Smr/MutS family protein [Holophagaceae bacterium]